MLRVSSKEAAEALAKADKQHLEIEELQESSSAVKESQKQSQLTKRDSQQSKVRKAMEQMININKVEKKSNRIKNAAHAQKAKPTKNKDGLNIKKHFGTWKYVLHGGIRQK
jgi:hypothetical protein